MTCVCGHPEHDEFCDCGCSLFEEDDGKPWIGYPSAANQYTWDPSFDIPTFGGS